MGGQDQPVLSFFVVWNRLPDDHQSNGRGRAVWLVFLPAGAKQPVRMVRVGSDTSSCSRKQQRQQPSPPKKPKVGSLVASANQKKIPQGPRRPAAPAWEMKGRNKFTRKGKNEKPDPSCTPHGPLSGSSPLAAGARPVAGTSGDARVTGASARACRFILIQKRPHPPAAPAPSPPPSRSGAKPARNDCRPGIDRFRERWDARSVPPGDWMSMQA